MVKRNLIYTTTHAVWYLVISVFLLSLCQLQTNISYHYDYYYEAAHP